jgi:hypothetical protein
MKSFDPASSDLGRLFSDPTMFCCRECFRDAGFEVLDRGSDRTIMVGRHPDVPGYLFKKYSDRTSVGQQAANYATRVLGARRIRAFAADRGLRHVVVPRKWVRALSSRFGGRSQVLIVERLKVLDDDDTREAYEDIDEDVLRELCVVLLAFRGLDSWTKNLPFTRDGRIAFIDTERWERSERPWLRHVGEHLSRSSWKIAQKIWKKKR